MKWLIILFKKYKPNNNSKLPQITIKIKTMDILLLEKIMNDYL
jgi:hypothetical protein